MAVVGTCTHVHLPQMEHRVTNGHSKIIYCKFMKANMISIIESKSGMKTSHPDSDTLFRRCLNRNHKHPTLVSCCRLLVLELKKRIRQLNFIQKIMEDPYGGRVGKAYFFFAVFMGLTSKLLDFQTNHRHNTNWQVARVHLDLARVRRGSQVAAWQEYHLASENDPGLIPS